MNQDRDPGVLGQFRDALDRRGVSVESQPADVLDMDSVLDKPYSSIILITCLCLCRTPRLESSKTASTVSSPVSGRRSPVRTGSKCSNCWRKGGAPSTR